MMARLGGGSARRFIVTSQGASATRWLAFVLASHPDVFVAHGHFALDSVLTGTFERQRAEGDRDSQEMGNVTRHLYETKRVEEIFEIFRHLKPAAAAYGAVHSYTLDGLLDRLEDEEATAASDLAIVNLVRHPLSYIESHCALVRKAERHPPLYRHYASELFSRTVRTFPELFLVDCPDFREFIAFSVSCGSILNVSRDLEHEEFEHFQMEMLTADENFLEKFCNNLTGLVYDREKLEYFIAGGAVNRHSAGSGMKDPGAIYAGWPNWKRDIFAVMIPKSVLDRFESVGYDVKIPDKDCAVSLGSEGERAPCLADTLKAMDMSHPLLPSPAGSAGGAYDPGAGPEPRLVGAEWGYNFVKFAGKVFALNQNLGEVHVADGVEALIARYGHQNVIVAETVGEARERIGALKGACEDGSRQDPAPVPRLIESNSGYNIVQLGAEFFCLKQGLGDVHVTDGAEALIQRYGDQNVVVAGTLEAAREQIRTRGAS